MKYALPTLALCLLAGATPLAQAQQDTPVSRAEYNQLKTEHEQLVKEMGELRSQMRQMMQRQAAAPKGAEQKLSEPIQETPRSAMAGMSIQRSEETADFKNPVGPFIPNWTQFLLSGWADATFVSSSSNRHFSVDFHPDFLFKLSENLSFESELEFSHSGNSSSFHLLTAELAYTFNDYVTAGAGRFANPANYFAGNLRKGLENKLPDDPFAVNGGLMPVFDDGFQLSGTIPIGSTLLKYAAFVATAPVCNHADANVTHVGQHLGVGGYLGFSPIPGMEIGYGIQSFKVEQRNQMEVLETRWIRLEPFVVPVAEWVTHPYDATATPLLQSLSLSFVKDLDALKGILNFQAQWVWSSVDRYPHPGDSNYDYEMYPYNSDHDGGYLQLAFRPIHLTCPARNLEPVVRFDVLNMGGTTFGSDTQGWTFGLNYWITEGAVLKGAYEISNTKATNDRIYHGEAFLLEFTAGF